jgi:hypothetical protein
VSDGDRAAVGVSLLSGIVNPDIDSTPQAIPTPSSPARIAWVTMIVALSDEPQN